jgi:hypothetical protein
MIFCTGGVHSKLLDGLRFLSAQSRSRDSNWLRAGQPFSSPPTTRRVTVEVFDTGILYCQRRFILNAVHVHVRDQLVYVRDLNRSATPTILSEVPFPYSLTSSRHGPRTENTAPLLLRGADHTENTFPPLMREVTTHALACLLSRCLATRQNTHANSFVTLRNVIFVMVSMPKKQRQQRPLYKDFLH